MTVTSPINIFYSLIDSRLARPPLNFNVGSANVEVTLNYGHGSPITEPFGACRPAAVGITGTIILVPRL